MNFITHVWRFTNFQTFKTRQLNPYARLVEEDLGVRIETFDYYNFVILYYIILILDFIILLYFMSIIVQMFTLAGSCCEKELHEGEKKSNIRNLSNIIGLSYSPIF